MNQQFEVQVSGVDFAAAHFVSELKKCERLHGHNYQVTVTITGELNPQGMVIDFRVLKQHLRQLCKQWDHFTLLPARSKLIKINQNGNLTVATTPDGTYSFPSKHVRILDVAETTAEELARILCQQLIKTLKTKFSNVTHVRVIVAESSTSQATVTMSV